MRSTGGGEGIAAWARLAGRDNALNTLRLAFACMVLVAHSWELPFGVRAPTPYLGPLAVDGFFAISGFLVAGSRTRMGFPPFLWRRVLRLLPGFWVCLLVTACAIAPFSAHLQGRLFDWSSSSTYVISNAAISIHQGDISGLLTGRPMCDWNSPLWTLIHEFRAYIIAGALLGFVRWRRRLSWALLAASVVGLWVVAATRPIDDVAVPRLLAFFASGMVYRFESTRMRLTAPGAALCGILLLALWAFGSEMFYWTLGPLPLTYLVLWLGAAAPVRIGARNDLSYGIYIYGGPCQQFLVSANIAPALGPGTFAALSVAIVIPLAAASWFAVERTALNLRGLMSTSFRLLPTAGEAASGTSQRADELTMP